MPVRRLMPTLFAAGFLLMLSGCHHCPDPCECSNSVSATTEESSPWLPATAEKLPRWRGFNLLGEGTFTKRKEGAPKFLEDDFRMVSELGFNFVRLPLDYRIWIQNGDWEKFDENVLKEIDQAVAWGEKYKLHVCLNFHRAPGYTVAKPVEEKSLWTDADAQRVCALHWAAFAKRYKGIPNGRLSFDLLNEPSGVEPNVYAEVVRKLVEAIRREDPERLIISDGLKGGSAPIPELKDLHIAEATRGYAPGGLTHYLASWAGQTNAKPVPTWPRLAAFAYFYGPGKKEMGGPLTIKGPFPKAATVRLHVDTVSQNAHLRATADGVAVWDKGFPCNAGRGEWKSSEFVRQYNVYRCVYDQDYRFVVPPGTKELKLEMTNGDWLKATELGLTSGGKEDVLWFAGDWGKATQPLTYNPLVSPALDSPVHMEDKAWLWETVVKPWKDLEAQGIGVMVGEWGCFNKTPHDVTLRWMEDCLQNWKQANWGWALWNFRGSFGVLDSGRADVEYEEYQGHKLDRKMLELLKKY